MLRLMLLRHAKSDWGDSGLLDIDRPLNARGRTAARTMGVYLATERLEPDMILCSSAQRTRETLALLLPALKSDCQVQIRSDLYRLSEDDYLPAIQNVGAGARNLMVIGHNPATEDTAIALIGSGPEEDTRDLQAKYPTGALAIIDFAIESWAEMKPGTGRLVRFVKPRKLDDARD